MEHIATLKMDKIVIMTSDRIAINLMDFNVSLIMVLILNIQLIVYLMIIKHVFKIKDNFVIIQAILIGVMC